VVKIFLAMIYPDVMMTCRMLLINASDVTIEKKAAFQGFHAEQHRGLYAVSLLCLN
jgi:hypothetical protein